MQSGWGLSKASYYSDFVLVPADLLVVLGVTAWFGQFGWAWFSAAGLGVLFWTLCEYLLHRFVFHGDTIFAPEHELHHLREAEYIGVSSIGTFLAIAATMGLTALIGGWIGTGFAFGTVGGYLAYIVVHDRMHHSQIGPGSLLYGLKMHHVGHHRGMQGNFGVTTTFWDRFFGTTPEKGEIRSKRFPFLTRLRLHYRWSRNFGYGRVGAVKSAVRAAKN